MKRRDILVRSTTGLAAAVSAGVAGCLGGGDGADGDTTDDIAGGDGDSAVDGGDGDSAVDGGDGDSGADGGDGDAEATPTPTPTETPTPTGTPASTDEPQGGLSLSTYEFAAGESYTYDANFAGEASEETWTVESVDGDDLTVERASAAGGDTERQTVSGTHDSIYDEVAQVRDVNYFPLARNALGYAEAGDLTAGNSFTVENEDGKTDWETATVDVLGDSTVNGVPCTEFTVTPDSVDQVTTVCKADGYPFAASLSISQDGNTLIEMTTIDATRP